MNSSKRHVSKCSIGASTTMPGKRMARNEQANNNVNDELYAEPSWKPVQSQFPMSPKKKRVKRIVVYHENIEEQEEDDDLVISSDEEIEPHQEELEEELQLGTQNFLNNSFVFEESDDDEHEGPHLSTPTVNDSGNKSQLSPFITQRKSRGICVGSPQKKPQVPPTSPKRQSPHNTSSSDEQFYLRHWGVEDRVIQEYKKDGVERLYPWQVSILQIRSVLNGRSNLIYCAPTSGGKTLVTEVLMLRRLTSPQNKGKKAFFIVPFITIVDEKVEQLRRRFRSLGLKVGSYYANTGGSIRTRDFADTHIIVCTIERGNSMIHQLIAAERGDEIAMIIIDECHMIGDTSRGYLLESMLTKLVFLQSNAQVIGMSATLPNVDQLATWLNAELFITNFRPVPLREFIVMNDSVYDTKTSTPVRKFVQSPEIQKALSLPSVRRLTKSLTEKEGNDMWVTKLCLEVVLQRKSVLIFCRSRFDCNRWSRLIASIMNQLALPVENEISEKRRMMIASLERSQTGLDPDLEISIREGVAFHHAGLTKHERQIIERGYREGSIQILTCTTTLSAGVNLPARRVIFASLYIAQEMIDVIRYRQSAGRAGRAGLDEYGETYLLTSPKNWIFCQKISNDYLPELISSLTEMRRCMSKCLLEAFDVGLIKSGVDIGKFATCTLFKKQVSRDILINHTKKNLNFLLQHRFVEFETKDHTYSISQLGSATNLSGFTPEESLYVKLELENAQNCMILLDDLHVIYHLTPFNHNLSVRWTVFCDLFQKLSPVQKKIAMSIGLQDGFLESMAHGQQTVGYPSSNIPLYHARQGSGKSPVYIRNQTIVQMRFFAALVLKELIDEAPWNMIEEKYCIHRGQIQALQESAVTFSSMISSYCTVLKWKHLKSLFSGMKHRLNFGVKGELVPLCSIPHVKAFIARALFKGGFTTVQSIAASSVEKIHKCLRDEIPFRGASNGDRVLDKHFAYLNKLELRRAQIIVQGAIKAVEENAILVYDEDEENSYYDEPIVHCFPTQNRPRAVNESANKNVEGGPQLKRKFTPVPIPSTMARIPLNSISPNSNSVQSNTGENRTISKRVLSDGSYPSSKRTKIDIQNRIAHNDKAYEIIEINTTDESSLRSFLKDLAKQTQYSFNLTYKTTEKSPCTSSRVTHTLTGVSICWASNIKDWKNIPIVDTVYYIPLNHNILQLLKPIFQDPSSIKISLNMQLHILLLYEAHIILPNTNLRDVIVADWIIRPNDEQAFTKQRKTLSQAWKQVFNSDLMNPSNNSIEHTIANSCQTSIHCFRLMMEQDIIMKDKNVFYPFETIEMPLASVLSKLEYHGVRFKGKDVNENGRCMVDDWIELVLTKQDKLEQQIKEFVQSQYPRDLLNKLTDGFLSSNDKLAEILFEDMKLSYEGRGTSRSTNKEVLQKLTDVYPSIPIFGAITLWRSLDNLRTKHLRSFCTEFVKLDKIEGIRKVYAHQVSTAHVTGRLNVENPNLQNVPHSIHFEHPNPSTEMIRNAIRNGQKAPLVSISIRNAFTPRNEKYVLLSADYQQIELRLIAHLSNDDSLINILLNPECDPFREMACVMFSCGDQSRVTDNQRKIVKELWYATIYGMGVKTLSSKLSRALNKSPKSKPEDRIEQARQYMHQFSERFQKMDQYRLVYVKQQLIEKGYVQTISGRRRYWDDVQEKLKDESTIESYRRHALSTICQGSAADIFKSSLILTDRYLTVLNSNRPRSQPIAALLMHIHDELVFEVEKDYLPIVAPKIKSLMETASSHFGVTIRLPTPVKMKVGPNWGQMSDYSIQKLNTPNKPASE